MSTPIQTPSPLVLDYIDRYIGYDPTTGYITKKGKILPYKYSVIRAMTLVLTLDTTYEGCSLRYITYYHHVAWYLTYGVWPSMQIDHIDRNPTNNRIGNLRLATNSQNGSNKGKYKKDATSKYKGVYKVKRRKGKWTAHIKSQGKYYHLGTYTTENDAARAYNVKASELFGEFAALN